MCICWMIELTATGIAAFKSQLAISSISSSSLDYLEQLCRPLRRSPAVAFLPLTKHRAAFEQTQGAAIEL